MSGFPLPADLAEKIEGKAVLTARETAEICRVSLPTMWESIRSGRVPSIRLGERAVRVPVAQLLVTLGYEDAANAEGTGVPVPSEVPAPIPFPNGKKVHRENTTTG